MALSLETANDMDAAAFADHFAALVEGTPWVAAALSDGRPYDSVESMIAAAGALLAALPANAQTAILNRHPDLAGKAARDGSIAEASKSEQAGAGLDRLSEAEFERFHRLNEAYKSRFGFPFIFAVKGATKDQILAAFEQRLSNTLDQERTTAIAQVQRIIGFRLGDWVGSG